MTEREAKQHLEALLDILTLGSVLHLLADHLHVQAEQARREDDAAMFDRCITAKHSLIVFGLGLDAAFPS
jgi:hypothetical protein